MRRQMNWLAERGLLHNSYTCPQCQVLCSLVVQGASQDGFRWRCRQCQHRASVRKGSFFKSNLPLGKLTWILLSWASDTPVHHVAWHLDVSQHKLVGWSNFIRDVCAEDTRRNPVQLGGFDANGQPIVVEIDESYFFHRKYHRGRFHNGLWVFRGRRTRERPMYAASGGRPNCPDLAAHHPAVVPPGHPHHL